MNIWDERCKSFITCLSPFCDWSCQFLHGQQDVKPNNSCQVQAFQDCLWANFQQFSNWFQFLLFEMMLVQTRMRYIVKLLYFLVCHFTISFNTFLSMSFHVVGPRHCMCLRFLPFPIFSLFLQQKYVIRTFLYIVQWQFQSVCIHPECIPNTRDQEMSLVRQDQRFFVNFFHMRAWLCFFPTIF